ncbi:hypothetical protein [Psychrobacillus sp. L4]|uniref:hypothetical protein n=1 Tax=Psychrobacillus sp. L4 TaxID=3236892 RepID=UPI0036F211F2
MLPLQQHAYELYKIFCWLDEGHYSEFEFPSEWLNLAAGVVDVKIVPRLYDSTIYWCGIAMDREKERGKLWSEFTKELTIFNFSWGAMESYIKMVCPELYDHKSKIRKNATIESAKKYLSENSFFIDIIEYADTYNKLFELMFKKMPNEIPGDFNSVSYNVKGLSLAKCVRNLFAHGARKLPDLDEVEDIRIEDIDLVLDIKMIHFATRAILFTLQFLLIRKYSDSGILIADPSMFDFSVPEKFEEGIPLSLMLKSLHLDYVITTENLTLDI